MHFAGVQVLRLAHALVKIMNNGKKRIFILLGMMTLVVYSFVFAAIWMILTSSSPLFKQILMIALISAFVMLILGMFAGLGCLVFSLWHWSESKHLRQINRYIVELFYPAVMRIGLFLGIDREVIEDSYIKINNQMTVAVGEKFTPQEILILAPHCLQKVDCPHKITIDVHNCHRCGQCSISRLLALAEENQVNFVVASGGTFARKMVKEYRPKAIIAIACERDLTSGIKDMKGIPVIGVLNERPNGPCYNTNVQICKVQQAIDSLLEQDVENKSDVIYRLDDCASDGTTVSS